MQTLKEEKWLGVRIYAMSVSIMAHPQRRGFTRESAFTASPSAALCEKTFLPHLAFTSQNWVKPASATTQMNKLTPVCLFFVFLQPNLLCAVCLLLTVCSQELRVSHQQKSVYNFLKTVYKPNIRAVCSDRIQCCWSWKNENAANFTAKSCSTTRLSWLTLEAPHTCRSWNIWCSFIWTSRPMDTCCCVLSCC